MGSRKRLPVTWMRSSRANEMFSHAYYKSNDYALCGLPRLPETKRDKDAPRCNPCKGVLARNWR